MFMRLNSIIPRKYRLDALRSPAPGAGDSNWDLAGHPDHWKTGVAQILADCDVAIVDVTCQTDNIHWEVREALRQLGKAGLGPGEASPYRIRKVVFLQDINANERPRGEGDQPGLEAHLSGARVELIRYDLGTRQGIDRFRADIQAAIAEVFPEK